MNSSKLFAIKQNRFLWERSQNNLLWYYGYCHKIQHCASLSTRSDICRWKISREHGLEWLWQLSERMCRTLDKTLCYRWGCLYRTHHPELPFVHWLHVVQRRYIRFTRWLQWLCWPTHELGRNTEKWIRSAIKKEITRFIQIMTMRGDLWRWLQQIASNYRNVMPEVKISNDLFFRLNKISYFCGQ